MNADEKSRYFQELSRNLQHEGLTVKPETEEGLLPVELDGQRLCLALDSGAISAGPDCLDYDEEIQRVNMAKTSLMAKKAELEREGRTAAAFDRRMEEITRELEQTAGAITEFDEITVRQLVSSIKVVSKNTLLICFKDGTEVTQTMENTGRASA